MALRSRRINQALVIGVVAVVASTVAACGSSKKSATSTASGGTSSGTITIGTTDKVVAVDPAGSYDNGSLLVEDNIYQFLMSVPAGQKAPQPDAAKSCSFTAPTEYTCILKAGQKFSNGDVMTADDVVFSYTRAVKIDDPNGPASLLANMVSVKASDASTVVFTLKNANDQTFPFILGTSAGPIVDSKVFAADKLLDDAKAIGSGPYMIKSYSKNQLVSFTANPNYAGQNKAKTANIVLKYYTASENLKLDIQSGAVDIAWRSMTPTDVDSLKSANGVKVLTGSGGEIRYLVFNYKTMPGDTDAQKLAIRQAVASSLDRESIATNVYKGTYSALYSMMPAGLAFASTSFKDAYGAKPDKAKAQGVLSAAGVTTPVTLPIEYTTDHYGPTSDQEYNEIKRQLEATGLFKVNLQSTEYVTYSKQRTQDAYPIYQLGWFPDYVDGDNYLSPFLTEDNFVHAHYCDPGVTNRPCDLDGVAPLLAAEETSSDTTARQTAFTAIQQKLATGQMPFIPLLQGEQVAAIRTGVSGVQETLDPTYQFRFWLFSKS